MTHRYVLKDNYWKMRISHPYSMLCSSNELAVSCGQAPIGEYGDVLFPGDLGKQTNRVISTMKQILSDGNLSNDDLERVVVFVSAQNDVDTNDCLNRFKHSAPDSCTIFEVPLPPLFYDDLLLEVDYYAIPKRSINPNISTFSISLDIDIHSDHLSANMQQKLVNRCNENLKRKNLDWSNVAKMSFFSPCKKYTFWESLASWRTRLHMSPLPAISDVVSEASVLNQITIDVTCVTNPQWGDSRPIGKVLTGGQPEAICRGPLLFTSALFSEKDTTNLSVADEVISIMLRHESLLGLENMSFSNVIKSTTFYDGFGSADALHENMSARNQYYRVPGPGSTGLPVSSFPIPRKRTSIELIASN